jgi:hypothetical protein
MSYSTYSLQTGTTLQRSILAKVTRKSAVLATATIAAAIMLIAPAFAAATFDPQTGIGFVGKGDVQTAFGWKNATLQINASDVSFSSVEEQTRSMDCVSNGNPANATTYTDARRQERDVAGRIDSDLRQVKGQKQFTGFILSGFVGQPHTVGGSLETFNCPAGQHAANGGNENGWSDWVTTGGGSQLYAKFGGNSVLLQ